MLQKRKRKYEELITDPEVLKIFRKMENKLKKERREKENERKKRLEAEEKQKAERKKRLEAETLLYARGTLELVSFFEKFFFFTDEFL
jgi:hypothetical protein